MSGIERKATYLVECYFGPTLGRAYVETEEIGMFTNIDELVREIVAGQFNEITSVHHVDFAAGTVRNVTDEVMDMVQRMEIAV